MASGQEVTQLPWTASAGLNRSPRGPLMAISDHKLGAMRECSMNFGAKYKQFDSPQLSVPAHFNHSGASVDSSVKWNTNTYLPDLLDPLVQVSRSL